MFLVDICKEFLSELSKLTTLLEVFVCLYAGVRFAVNRNQLLLNSARNFLFNAVLSFLCIVLSVFILIAVFVFLITPFLLFKLLVILVLRLRYRQNYAGLLNCADTIWLIEDDKSRNIVNFLFLIQFDKSKSNLTDYVRKVCSKKFLRSKRLTCVRKKFMGYVCLVENQLTVDDVVRDLKMLSNELHDAKALQQIVRDYSNKPLPKNDTATWELLIGQRPIRLEGLEDEGDQYPLLIRVHHSIGDGVTFLSVLVKYISDEGTSILHQTDTKTTESSGFRIWRRMKELWRVHAYLYPLVHPSDDNLLHGQVLSGEKNVGFYIESKPKYLQIVKKLKSKFPGATFSDVIFTAISASLHDYFKRYSNSSLTELTLAFIAVTNRNDLMYLHDKLSNIFSMGFINLPINLEKDEDVEATLIERFVKTQKEYKKFAQSYDIWINHLQLQTFANVLPVPVLRQVVKMNDVSTVAFSNLPGFKKIHISGQALNHMLFWIPNYLRTGVGFSIVTYDDRFHMGLMIDKVLVPDEDRVQQVLNDVFKYIDLLDEKLDAKNKGEKTMFS